MIFAIRINGELCLFSPSDIYTAVDLLLCVHRCGGVVDYWCVVPEGTVVSELQAQHVNK